MFLFYFIYLCIYMEVSSVCKKYFFLIWTSWPSYKQLNLNIRRSNLYLDHSTIPLWFRALLRWEFIPKNEEIKENKECTAESIHKPRGKSEKSARKERKKELNELSKQKFLAVFFLLNFFRVHSLLNSHLGSGPALGETKHATSRSIFRV